MPEPANAAGETPQTLDTTGLKCPLPVLRMEARLRSMAPGGRLLVIADDPIAAVDIPHFAREAGHDCERQPDKAGLCVFLVTHGQKP